MPVPIREDSAGIDLGSRFFQTTTVTGSPAAATETIVATLATSGDIASTKGVFLVWSLAYTVGTNGITARYRIRQTDAAGTTKYDSGLITVVAATLLHVSGSAFDAAPVLPGQVYVLTLTIGSGSASSAVSAANLLGVVV